MLSLKSKPNEGILPSNRIDQIRRKMKDELPVSFDDLSRRSFLRLGTMTAIGATLPQLDAESSKSAASSMIGVLYSPVNPRIGIIGTGGRGTNLLENLLGADAQILALCDVVQEKAEHAQSLVVKSGQKSPELYTKGDHAFESLVARDDLDLVIISTP